MFADNPIVNKYKEWDKSLLLNHPRLWALRLPTLLGYFVVFNLIAVIICFTFPLRIYHVTSMFTWLWLFGVVELIPLGFWLWKFSKFSPEKELERTTPVNGMLEILLYMVCIFIFLSPTLTSSAILEYRFSRMIQPEVFKTDFQKVCGDSSYSCLFINTNTLFSQDLVEKYTPVDYETYESLKYSNNTQFNHINRDMGRVIRDIYVIKRGKDYDWRDYLFAATVLLHISVFMFAGRHIQRGVFGKSIAYGVGIVVIAAIIQGIVLAFFMDYSSYPASGMDTQDKVYLGTALFILAFTLFFSLRVFWQKKYRNFTAMNITILPYVVYFEVFILFSYLEYESDFVGDLFDKWIDMIEKAFGDFWGYHINFLIVSTPLLILPLYILIKAMYIRLLALPEG